MRHTTAALAALLVASSALAQGTPAAKPAVGQRVVIKYKQPLRFGTAVVEPKEYRSYTVGQVEGDQLLLVAGGISGWVRADDVVPLDQAVNFYTQEITKQPTSWNAYLYRGFVWDVKHEYDKAIADFSEAIRLYPYWANTFNNRGWTWHRKKELDKAIADYNEAIRLDPTCVLAISNRGLARQDKGEYYKAHEDYGRSVKVDPSYARGWAARAWLYATCPDKKFRDGKLAVATATKACELTGWKEADKLGVLAAAYAEKGDFAKAVRWQEKANERYVDPEDRKKGVERLWLYKDKKPYRTARPAAPGQPQDVASDDAIEKDPWSEFKDPELAARIYAELEERVGKPPAGDDARASKAREAKVTAAIEVVGRKHHLKLREVRSIWNAGTSRVKDGG
jgi:tetratricopeptide (TPR) repeat protein